MIFGGLSKAMLFVLRTERQERAGHTETWKNISANANHRKQTNYEYVNWCPNTIVIKEVKISQQLGMILYISLANVLKSDNIRRSENSYTLRKR